MKEFKTKFKIQYKLVFFINHPYTETIIMLIIRLLNCEVFSTLILVFVFMHLMIKPNLHKVIS